MSSLLIALFIVLGAYFIRGITGFGSGLLAVPLLALVYPLQTVVPVILVLDLLAALVMSHYARTDVQWGEIIPLLPGTLIGITLGVSLLVSLPQKPLLIMLSGFVMVFGLRYLLNIHGSRTVSRAWSVPAGLGGGLIGAMFGTGGPPYIIYLNHRVPNASQLRATLSGIFMLDSSFRVIVFLVSGLLGAHLLFELLVFVPVVLVALYLGNHVHVRISHRQMLALIGVLLLVSGVTLLIKAWT